MADLYDALERSAIVPYFQPLIELRTGQLTGFEVLARWHHPVRGLVSPIEFIPLAEGANLIDALLQKLLAPDGAGRPAAGRRRFLRCLLQRAQDGGAQRGAESAGCGRSISMVVSLP